MIDPSQRLRFLSPQARRFDTLVRPHLPAMYRLALQLTGHRDDAEDLVQDVLTKLYPRTYELSTNRDLRPWLQRVLYHAFIDRLRHTRSRPDATQADEHAVDGLADVTADPLTSVATAELAARIDAALAQLEPEQRALVVLHFSEGNTLEALTQVFDVPLGTLKSRLHRARAKLKVLLGMEPFAAEIRNVDQERQRPSVGA
jgi:RNA polymerase sigma factor (sigma-70 family)